MINLGRYKATGLPELRMPFTMTDRIFTILSVLVMLAIWILITFFYIQNPENQGFEVLVWGGASSFITLLLYISLRMPARMFNFPIRVNEQNLGRQFFLARRMVVIAMFEMNLIMLFRMLQNFEASWGVKQGLFDILSFIIMGLLGVTFLVYFIMAYRWR